jgi:hypothetical protein
MIYFFSLHVGEDFVDGYDLLMACTILQKQIEHINGKIENVIVPIVAMKKIRDQQRIGAYATFYNICYYIVYILEDFPSKNQTEEDARPTNPCVLCLEEEKRLACIPCGHLATCVPCGYFLRSCPICHQQIEAFVRIYI